MNTINITFAIEGGSDLTADIAEEVRQHLIRQYADIMPVDPTISTTADWAPEQPTETADLPPIDEFAGTHPTPEEDDDA